MSATKTTFPSNDVAQSSRSSTIPSPNSELECSYDIFLSFRGSDTRKKFTDHLYNAFKQEGLQTFRDEDEIKRGEDITPKLREAIYSSRMSVIVLSKNYANSRSCLSELRTILEYRGENSGHFVLPVFYEVEPSDIKKQAKNLNFGGTKGPAIFWKLLAYITFFLSKLARREEEPVTFEEVNGWTMALEEVCSIAGMVSQSQCDGYEANIIKEIVAVVKSKLSGKHLRDADLLASKGVVGKEYMLLEELSEQTFRWTIKVKVVNIWGPSLAKDGKTMYKRFMLQDEKGEKIHATMYGEVIKKFNDTLELHKTYLISRGLLSKVATKHKQGSPDQHECQITLINNSMIEEVKNEGIKPSETELKFIPLRYIPELKSMASPIDIVAIVLRISPKENRKRKRDQLDITSRDIILIDHSLQTTALTTWGKFIHNECDTLANMLHKRPIIVATKLQLKDGENRKRYVSTTQLSEILINLEIPEVKRLEAWKLEKENVLKNISSKSGSFSTLSINTIQEILDTADMGATYHLKASITTILQQEQCWYSACSSCHKKTTQQIRTTFTCDSCGEPSATEKLRPYVRVELGDSTGNLPTTLFGTNAEKVLSCEANQFITRDFEEQLKLLEKWTNERTGIDYIFHVKLEKRRDTMSLNTIKVEDAK